ncbi:MAG: bifunctional glutamate N-acetyltransferase/amino-acid acetyltransferase ArgJ [Burkholderiales bacterium]|jgi:glutamate N-acetyltransferase/amino-acid N-acetyltransferase|nr:bifunctional glutamate N-acetyltransferase/amino-acid acetyltransferase ArgJ [Burkholderiales bacterium]
MPVCYTPSTVDDLFPVPGVRLGAVAARIKNWQRNDVLVIECAAGATAAAVFTQNRFCAAPVLVDREHLAWQQQHGKSLRAVVVNAGNANAGTGASGLDDARRTCRETAALLGCAPEEVMVCSTGVIMEPLPIEKLLAGLPEALRRCREENAEESGASAEAWLTAAQAIMTTDTVHKAASAQAMIDGVPITVTGIAKGAGMIHPNMATMLGFIATDMPIAASVWQSLLREITDVSFNAVTVDGDTSTNDTLIGIATGQANVSPLKQSDDPRLSVFKEALREVAVHLAQAIARDGEGATKFITIQVEGGRNVEECRQVALKVAHSPLVKTAFFASDPNLGRIVCAIGNAAPPELDVSRVQLWLDDVVVIVNGGRASSYTEEAGQRVMNQPEITVRIDLGLGGNAVATVWTCDLSHDYVSINADYRS